MEFGNMQEKLEKFFTLPGMYGLYVISSFLELTFNF